MDPGRSGARKEFPHQRPIRAPSTGPGYGYNLQNTRFNPNENFLGNDNVERLKIKWQFDLDVPIETTPVVIGDLLFLGVPGAVYALNTRTGERKWKYEMVTSTDGGQQRTPGMGRGAQYYEGRIYFGDSSGVMHCLDAATGKPIWTTNVQVDTDRTSPIRIHCACAAFDGKIYVGTVGQMNRALCLDADTGAIRWQFWVTGPEYPGGCPWLPRNRRCRCESWCVGKDWDCRWPFLFAYPAPGKSRLPSFTRAAACFRLAGVMRLIAPSWSSLPQRPQLEISVIHRSRSSSVTCSRVCGCGSSGNPLEKRCTQRHPHCDD